MKQENLNYLDNEKVNTYSTFSETEKDRESVAVTKSAEKEMDIQSKPTRAERLYEKFTERFPDIVNSTHTNGHYGHTGNANKPLFVEHLGEETYGIKNWKRI